MPLPCLSTHIGCLKDLKRFWRLDESDDDRTVARIFAQVGVLKNDLIHILDQTLGTGPKGDRIALACGMLSFRARHPLVTWLTIRLMASYSRVDLCSDLAHQRG